MSALSIQVPFPVFQDRDGQPLENGYVWIGVPNLPPQTNPVNVYFDEALTILAPQPLRTINGYISNAGTPAQVYIDGVNFSILVQDSQGTMVYNFPEGTGISPDACGVTYNPPFVGAVPYPVCEKLAQTVSVKDFGAVGDGVTDDTAAIVTALNALQDNQILDLVGGTYALFVGNNGVTSGDAIPLADVPRLFNKSGITIRNGTLFAANPGTSGTKVRYPTTLSFESCTNMRLENVILQSRGESYGDSDAGSPLGSLDRARFSIQNGGHAFLFTRSEGLTAINCRFERCGSTGACYIQSSNKAVFDNCYSSAESLGYNAFACDAWAGDAASLGYSQFETILNNCCSDNNGATYGSKGCVLGEDADVIIQVNGGVWKDAYANGAANKIGYAFGASSSKIYVRGAYVENCASLGYGSNTSGAPTVVECIAVKARLLRTSFHIQDFKTFGDVVARYESCDAEISGSQLWPSVPELSVATVIANFKTVSKFNIDIIACRISGAHTFAINTKACYGGVKVLGGEHTVTDRIFDSAGWGGSSAGTLNGYVLLNTKFNVLLVNPAVISSAITNPATTAINAITNRDPSLVFTYQFIDFNNATQINANAFRSFATIFLLGSGLGERRVLAQALNDCFQTQPAGIPTTTQVKVISRDGIAGSNVLVTFAFLGNRSVSSNSGKIVGDDAFAIRQLISANTAASAVGTELQQQWFVNSATYDLTVGSLYNLVTRD